MAIIDAHFFVLQSTPTFSFYHNHFKTQYTPSSLLLTTLFLAVLLFFHIFHCFLSKSICVHGSCHERNTVDEKGKTTKHFFSVWKSTITFYPCIFYSVYKNILLTRLLSSFPSSFVLFLFLFLVFHFGFLFR